MRQRFFTYLIPLSLVTSEAWAGSMPQMDRQWYPNQLFWLAVSFIVLYILVAYIITPRVEKVLGVRKRTVDDLVEEADSLKTNALAARTHYEKVEADARAKASDMIARVTAEMNSTLAETQARMDADMKKRVTAADAAIAEKLSTARAGVPKAAASLAHELYHLLMSDPVDAGRFEKALTNKGGAS
jgi:F-type H+-transporting ATPase subunit b